MSETLTLRRVPTLRTVAIQQVKLIDQAKRFTLLVGLLGMAATVGLPLRGLDASGLFPLMSLIFATLIWPLLVWNDEKPSRRAYHRFLPVNHFDHDLLKVGAGAAFLMIAIAIVMATLSVISLLADMPELVGGMTLPVWLNFFTAPLIVYLLFSVVPMLAERPIEWMIGVVVLYAGLGILLAKSRSSVVAAVYNAILDDGDYSLMNTLTAPYFRHAWLGENSGVRSHLPTSGEWLLGTLLWLALALGAVCIASRIANRRAAV